MSCRGLWLHWHHSGCSSDSLSAIISRRESVTQAALGQGHSCVDPLCS